MKWLFALLLTGSLWAEEVLLPKRTRVLMVSLTKWPSGSPLRTLLAPRLDDELAAGWRDWGVGRLTFLRDEQACRTAILEELQALTEAAAGDETLVVYLQGHGRRDMLYAYDGVLAYRDLDRALGNWEGARLILVGDCCGSGSLETWAEGFERSRPSCRVAVLSSTPPASLSTGNWTFTEALIRVLRGDALCDGNQDGRITLEEAGRFVHEQMKFKEDQLSRLYRSRNFSGDLVFRESGPRPRPLRGALQIGDILEARDSRGNWYPAEILEATGDLYLVAIAGWEQQWQEWLPSTRLRPLRKERLLVGERYEVRWMEGWRPAVITESLEDYFYFAHFEGAGAEDEWITAERARTPTGPQQAPPAGNSTL